MIYRPPKKVAPERDGTGARRTSRRIVARSLSVAYRDLQIIAADRRESAVLRALAQVATVPIHRILLIISTDTDRDVDAGYLDAALDVAATTSRALLDQEATR